MNDRKFMAMVPATPEMLDQFIEECDMDSRDIIKFKDIIVNYDSPQNSLTLTDYRKCKLCSENALVVHDHYYDTSIRYQYPCQPAYCPRCTDKLKKYIGKVILAAKNPNIRHFAATISSFLRYSGNDRTRMIRALRDDEGRQFDGIEELISLVNREMVMFCTQKRDDKYGTGTDSDSDFSSRNVGDTGVSGDYDGSDNQNGG